MVWLKLYLKVGMMYKTKYSNKWVEHNKKEFGVQIIALKEIINKQVEACGKSDEFTSDMLVALISGRKITPKMEDAIDNRDEWVQKVVPKIMMVKEMISQTDWTENYRAGSYQFVNSIIKQAKSRKSLSKKQMEAVSNLYLRVKKNIDKQHGGK